MKDKGIFIQTRQGFGTDHLFSVWPILIIFSLAGVGSLVYQVAWVKLLTRTFGVTNFAVATVLSAFMAGLALGGFLGGKVAGSNKRNGLKFFGIIQIVLSLYTFALPSLFDGLSAFYRPLVEILENGFYLLAILRFAFSFLLLVVPCSLIGAAFPILVQTLTGLEKMPGTQLARLYSWNTWGSVAGSLVTGFVLMGIFGLKTTMAMAAILNMGAGLLALVLSRKRYSHISEKTINSPPVLFLETEDRGAAKVFLAVVFLSGFAALGYEVVWMRILNLLSHHGVYVFSSIVAVVLTGIAIGSHFAAWAIARKGDLLRILTVIHLFIGLGALLWMPLVTVTMIIARYFLGGTQGLNVCFGLGCIVTFIPCFFMGVSFPLAVHLYSRETKETGRRAGEAYSINVFGAAVGSVVAGFVLLPFVGAQRTMGLLGLANIIAVFLLARSGRWRGGLALGVLALGAIVGTLFLAPNTLYRALFKSVHREYQVDQVFEGVEGSVVAAHIDTVRYIFTNGVHDANTTPRMLDIHRLIGYLPGFVFPSPRFAMVVGLGGGATAGALARYTQERVDVVELSAGMVSAAKLFKDHNNNVLENPRVRIRVTDGRNYLQYTGQKYDVIVADAIYPMLAQSSSLYSVDWFKTEASHLSDSGVVVQWIDTGLEEYERRILLRTFIAAFPHVSLWGNMFVLGSKRPLTIKTHKTDGLPSFKLAGEMGLTGIKCYSNDSCKFAMNDQQLRIYAGRGLIVSDDHPYNEYFRLLRIAGIGKWLDQRKARLPASPGQDGNF